MYTTSPPKTKQTNQCFRPLIYLYHILQRDKVLAAGNTKLLNQEVVDKLALGILALLDGQELRQLREFLQGVGSIGSAHLVPVGANVVMFTKVREELIGQLLILSKSGKIVVFLDPVNLDDGKNTASLGVKVVVVNGRHVCIVTLEGTVLDDHLLVVGSLHARRLGLLEEGVVGGGFRVILDRKEVLDLGVETAVTDTLGRAGRGVGDFVVADVLLLAVTAAIGAVVESAVANTGIVGRLPVREEVSGFEGPALGVCIPVEVRTPDSHAIMLLVQLSQLVVHDGVVGSGIQNLGSFLHELGGQDLDGHLSDQTEGTKTDAESLQFFSIVLLIDDTELSLRVQHTQCNDLGCDITEAGSRTVSAGGGSTDKVLNTLNAEIAKGQVVGLQLLDKVIDIPAGTKGDDHVFLIDMELLEVGEGNDIAGLLSESIVDTGSEVTESMTISNNFDMGARGVLLLEELGSGILILRGNVGVRLASDLKLPVEPAIGGARYCVQQHQQESQLRAKHFGVYGISTVSKPPGIRVKLNETLTENRNARTMCKIVSREKFSQ